MSAYFAPLVLLPTVIKAPGQYLTRAGDLVTIDRTSQRHDFGCVGRYADGIGEQWHRSGRIYASTATANDIIAARLDA